MRVLPVPPLNPEQAAKVTSAATAIVGHLKRRRRLVETSRLYRPARELDGRSFERYVLDEYQGELVAMGALYDLIGEIEAVFAEAIGAEQEWVDRASGPSVWSYGGTEVPPDLEALFALTEDRLVDVALGALGGARYLAVPSYSVDRRIELLCHLSSCPPSSILGALRDLPPPEWFRTAVARRVLSWAVGRVFGRWSEASDAPSESAFAEVEDVTRGSELPVIADEELTRRLRDLGRSGGLADDGILDSAAVCLGRSRGVAEYFNSGFFSDHVSTYSASRRKAPVYWHLQVPSKLWGIWLYAPKLSRETLFAVVREADQRRTLAERQVEHLLRESEGGDGVRSARELARALEAEQTLAVELATFKAEVERIALLGWEPDLDDGMVLNAAPLADLFPAWRDAAAYRDDLRHGKYQWATVAQFADQL